QGLEEAPLRDVEARTQVAELERQIGALREQRQADAAERAAQLEQLRTRLAEAEAAAANGSAQVGEWERERDLLAAELHEAAVGEQRAQEELRAATERAAAATEADLQRALATARAAEDARAAANVVVVDDDPAWAAAAGEGRQVTVMRAGDAALESLGGTPLTCVVVNLAARGALAALATLREAGSSAPIWGCLATPGAGRALPLGPVEPVARPVDPDAVLATFRRHAARNARVLAAGADADALISLRQALVREGMSVAMAWDGARAVELLDTHRPEIVVIDLALAGRA